MLISLSYGDQKINVIYGKKKPTQLVVINEHTIEPNVKPSNFD